MRGTPGEGGWEGLFRLVFEHSSNPVVLLDEQRRIIDANEAAGALWGQPREELLHASIEDSIEPAERPRARAEWEQFLRSGEYAGSRTLLRADGSPVSIEFAARNTTVGGSRRAIYVMVVPNGAPAEQLAQEAASPLSAREREVVTLIALGKETGEIAADLHIAPETVRTHVRNAMAKLGAHTRAQLVAIAICAEHALDPPRVQGQAGGAGPKIPRSDD